MALELTNDTPTLVDPHNGAVDLLQRVLRTPLSPQESFSDDPLRMLRAARFITKLELVPEEGLLAAVTEMAPRLEIVSAERIRDEFEKIICTPHPTAGLWFLVETGLAELFLPELPAMRLEHDPIHRHKDVLTHTLQLSRTFGHTMNSTKHCAILISVLFGWLPCSTTLGSLMRGFKKAKEPPSTITMWLAQR